MQIWNPMTDPTHAAIAKETARSSLPPIIGLTGYAQSGKDTLGTELTKRHLVQTMSFAATLKRFAYAVNPMIEIPGGLAVRYAAVVDKLGLDRAKTEIPDIRRLLQRIGTEGGRELLGEDVWVTPVIEAALASPVPVVITDVRFANEAAAVKAAGGMVIRIARPGTGPVNGHASDAGVGDLDVDAEVANDGSVRHLYRSAMDAVLDHMNRVRA